MNAIQQLADDITVRFHTTDPFLICKYLGVVVVTVELTDNVKGFYSNLNGIQMIFLNDSLAPELLPITVAHELGHALLHPAHNALFLTRHTNFVSARFEYEANLFAKYLLPTGSLLKESV